MALRKVMERLRTPVDELDRARLEEFCDRLGASAITEITPRTPVRVAGEVHTVRIVPRAGAPALEVTVTDGRGSITAVFLGRRRIAGLTPGRRLVLEGVVGREGTRLQVFNPQYELLA